VNWFSFNSRYPYRLLHKFILKKLHFRSIKPERFLVPHSLVRTLLILAHSRWFWPFKRFLIFLDIILTTNTWRINTNQATIERGLPKDWARLLTLETWILVTQWTNLFIHRLLLLNLRRWLSLLLAILSADYIRRNFRKWIAFPWRLSLFRRNH
jgi:hypothetical protein